MQTIKVKVDDSSLDFFLELLKKFNFISEIQVSKKEKKPQDNNLPPEIRAPKGNPSITDFSDLWADNPKTIEQIRSKAWKRN